MIRTFSSDSIDRIARAVRRVERLPLGGVVRRGKLAEGGEGLDLSKVAFGCTLSGAVVTVNTGRVSHGSRAIITVAGSDITITEDQTWIWVSYIYGASATIESGLTEPRDTETTHNRALSLWALSDGVVSLERICHMGDVVIPGAFA